MEPLLSIEKVSVSFTQPKRLFARPQPSLRAVDEVSAEIGEGETLALVGESGSGKTTLGHVVAGLRMPSAGKVRLRGSELDAKNRGVAGRAIQIVFQDPFSALDPRMPVSDIIAEPLRIQGIGTKNERRARAAALVEEVGLPQDALNRYPHEFSGGQRQRIAIARALAPSPALIVADEPLSALDVSIQSQILNLFRDIQRREKLSYLFISHDLGVVEHLADRVARYCTSAASSSSRGAKTSSRAPRIPIRARCSIPCRGSARDGSAGAPSRARCRARSIHRRLASSIRAAPWRRIYAAPSRRASSRSRARPSHFAACHFKE